MAKASSTQGKAKGAKAKPAAAKSSPATKSKPNLAAQPQGKEDGAAKAAPRGKAGTAPAAKARAKTATGKAAGTATSASAAAKPAAKRAARATGKTTAASKKAPASKAKQAGARPWLASYAEGTPAEIGPLPAASVGDLLAEACKQHAERPAFTCMDATLTYAQLGKYAEMFGAYLQSKGLKQGARVAIMMPNVLQYPVALMGILRAGYVVVNVNPLYTPRELERQLVDSGAEAIVILENFAATLQAVVARTPVKTVIVATMGDMLGAVKGTIVNLVVRRVKKLVPVWSLPGHVSFKRALQEGATRSLKAATVGPDDLAFLQYTGGTTGVSKGAMLLHRNVLANVSQNLLWLETAYINKPRPASLTFACALPLYHIYALTVNALMGMQQGGHNILIPNPRDIPALVKELGKYPINIFPGLNTLFNALLNNEDFRKLDFKPMLLTFGGGMAVQSAVAERWHKVTGIIISEGYGLSETSPVATINRFDADSFSGTIGLPIPSTDISIRDEDGKPVAIGKPGEICIKGPQVMAGYWNQPEETAKVMTADGYFKSGDIGIMDSRGYTKIVDRKKDMILVSGFNVYPNELEEVVAKHPGVLEVAAVGVPDAHSGEVPKLFIVKKDPTLTEAEVVAYCQENLTGYKRPRHIEFRDELPKTNVGKILRRELRK